MEIFSNVLCEEPEDFDSLLPVAIAATDQVDSDEPYDIEISDSGFDKLFDISGNAGASPGCQKMLKTYINTKKQDSRIE